MVEPYDSPARQFDLPAAVARRLRHGGRKLDGDEGGRVIAKLTGLKSSSPVIEGSDGVFLEPTKFGDGELGKVKSTKSVAPLLGELRIGNFGHGFLLSAERNPPAYRPRQHGQIERLPSRHLNRRVIVRKAEEFIRSHLCDPPSILELCEFTGAGRRALFYAFDELIGLSPIAYLKAARLQEARKRILASDQQHCVQVVARNLNFSHLGQFSIDYAKHFGESPSQTCKRFHGAS